jgi:hypothetical protein
VIIQCTRAALEEHLEMPSLMVNLAVALALAGKMSEQMYFEF